ncbi:MAG: DUF2877 domain-containing protein [Cellulomonas sp.]
MAVDDEAVVAEVPRRARISSSTQPWAAGVFRVVHVGQSSLILAALGADSASDLVAITSQQRGLVPGGVCLPDDAELARLLDMARRVAPGVGTLDLRRWVQSPPPEIVEVDLRLPRVRLGPRAVAELRVRLVAADRLSAVDPLMDPRPQRALAEPLAHAALAGDDEALCGLLLRLVGSGPGATPAGDDVVVGVLATLSATRSDAHARLSRHLPALLSRTTVASRHDLAAAVDGCYAEHVHRTVAALADVRLVPATVERARTWGATSGLDQAAGVTGSAIAILRAHAPTAPLLVPRPLDRNFLRRSA